MIGEIIAPSREELLGEESKDATLDVAVLDAAFWACGAVNGHSHAVGPYGRKGVAIVPDSIASLRGFAGRIAPDTKCIVRALVRDRVKLPLGYSQVIFDFVVYDENGRPTWQATGFRATEF